MSFETINPGAQTTSNPKVTGSESASKNLVSEEEALRGADHARSTVFSVSDMSKNPGAIGTPPSSGTSVSVGQLVQGKIVVEMLDAVIPSIFVVVFFRFRIEVRKSQLQLTQAEKNTLSPLVEACMNSINLDFSNPWVALSVTMLFIYGGKAFEVGAVGAMEKKIKENSAASTVPTKGAGGVKIVQMQAKPPEPSKPAVSGNTDSFKEPSSYGEATAGLHPDGPPVWTESDVDSVVRKRKGTRQDAINWLNNSWLREQGHTFPGKRGGLGGTKKKRK